MKSKIDAYLLFMVVTACLGGLLFGYHTAIISGTLGFLSKEWSLSPIDEGMIGSVLFLGAFLGVLSGGWFSQSLGRKKTMIISALFFGLGSYLSSQANSYSELFISRMLSGIGVGMNSVASPLYLAEISPPNKRGAIVSGYQLANTIGILGAYLIGYLLAPEGNWRGMFLFGIVFAFLQIIALFFVKESSVWLSRRLHQENQEIRKEKKPLRFKKLLFIGGALSLLQQITGINAIISYAPEVFKDSGYASPSYILALTALLGLVNMVATGISGWLLDCLGRRRLLLIGTLGMACSLITFTGFSFFNFHSLGSVSLFTLVLYMASFAIGLGPVTWVILSEIYPLKIRSLAMSIATLLNWIGGYFVVLTFPDFLEKTSVSTVFLVYGLINLLAFSFVFRFIPETKGKSLDEIDEMLNK